MAFDYKEKFSVAGKKCIVTGAAQGLSRGMAEGLLENGAEVVLMDLQAEKLQAVADEYCKMGYKAEKGSGNILVFFYYYIIIFYKNQIKNREFKTLRIGGHMRRCW